MTAVLYNGLGRYDAALAGAREACEYQDLGFYGWSLVELIEAAASTGADEQANAALQELEARARAAGTDRGLGMLARSKALLDDGAAADALYRESILRLERSRIAVHVARAHLVYGEWLRRESRRVDAREQLRTAFTLLTDIGADAFAERARRELLATGETARKRSADSGNTLTAQEAQVAGLAAEGRTNPEIAARLFISPRTAEYHLHKVFGKLGVNSRSYAARCRSRPSAASSPRCSHVPSSGKDWGVDRGVRRMRRGAPVTNVLSTRLHHHGGHHGHDHHQGRHRDLLQGLGRGPGRDVLARLAAERGRVGRADAVPRAGRLPHHRARPLRSREFQPVVERERHGHLRRRPGAAHRDARAPQHHDGGTLDGWRRSHALHRAPRLVARARC